jgi:hypothetical protein
VSVHLTYAYAARPVLFRGPKARTPKQDRALAACSHRREPEQVSIYDDPEDEKLITCEKCLAWLAKGDNRLFVTKDGMKQWIANRMAEGDQSIRYIDIPDDDA